MLRYRTNSILSDRRRVHASRIPSSDNPGCGTAAANAQVSAIQAVGTTNVFLVCTRLRVLTPFRSAASALFPIH